jgi:hypothetical protein
MQRAWPHERRSIGYERPGNNRRGELHHRITEQDFKMNWWEYRSAPFDQ